VLSRGHLEVEIVPQSSWYKNARDILPESRWRRLSRARSERACHRCEVCDELSLHRRLDLHERWHYDDESGIQRLVGLISLCVNCHAVVHYGRTMVHGDPDAAFQRLRTINGWSDQETDAHIGEVSRVAEQRGQTEWALDVTYIVKAERELFGRKRSRHKAPRPEPDALVVGA
jgi:hypothetical protein